MNCYKYFFLFSEGKVFWRIVFLKIDVLMIFYNKFVVLISLELYCMILFLRVYWKYFLKIFLFYNYFRFNIIMMCIRLVLILIFWIWVISRFLGCVGGVMVEVEFDVVFCGLGVVVIVIFFV